MTLLYDRRNQALLWPGPPSALMDDPDTVDVIKVSPNQVSNPTLVSQIGGVIIGTSLVFGQMHWKPEKPSFYISGTVESIYDKTLGRQTNIQPLIGENPALFDSLTALKTDLSRLATLDKGWDGEDSDPISTETMQSAETVLEQISAKMLRIADAVPTPKISPYGDGRLCFSWKRGNRELWIHIENQIADVYRWEPLQQYEAQPFEQIAIPDVQEHVAWLLS